MYLSRGYEGDPRREVRHFAELGVDGFFTDFPDVAVTVLGPPRRH
jgi:glycerophosphoryl diester phosphodiesterase